MAVPIKVLVFVGILPNRPLQEVYCEIHGEPKVSKKHMYPSDHVKANGVDVL